MVKSILNTKSISIGVSAWFAALATVAACGGSSDNGGGNCSNVSPCGGNVVGTWKITNVCASGMLSNSLGSVCPGASEQVGSINASGTATFNSDGTYSTSTTASASVTLTIPNSCLSQSGVTISCGAIGSSLANPDAGTSGSCASNGSNCDCTVASSPMSSSSAGMYTTSGTTITTTPTGNSSSSNDYCVQGNTLYLLSNAGPDAGATGGTMETIVLTKQ